MQQLINMITQENKERIVMLYFTIHQADQMFQNTITNHQLARLDLWLQLVVDPLVIE